MKAIFIVGFSLPSHSGETVRLTQIVFPDFEIYLLSDEYSFIVPSLSFFMFLRQSFISSGCVKSMKLLSFISSGVYPKIAQYLLFASIKLPERASISANPIVA